MEIVLLQQRWQQHRAASATITAAVLSVVLREILSMQQCSPFDDSCVGLLLAYLPVRQPTALTVRSFFRPCGAYVWSL